MDAFRWEGFFTPLGHIAYAILTVPPDHLTVSRTQKGLSGLISGPAPVFQREKAEAAFLFIYCGATNPNPPSPKRKKKKKEAAKAAGED